jgi:hypothetical protein
VFVLGKPFQPSLIFAGKAGAYPSEALFRLARDKRSSLLRKVVTYGRKKFYKIATEVDLKKSFWSKFTHSFV